MTLLRRDFLHNSAAACAGLAASSLLAGRLVAADAPAKAAPRPLRAMFYGGALPTVLADLEKRVKLLLPYG